MDRPGKPSQGRQQYGKAGQHARRAELPVGKDPTSVSYSCCDFFCSAGSVPSSSPRGKFSSPTCTGKVMLLCCLWWWGHSSMTWGSRHLWLEKEHLKGEGWKKEVLNQEFWRDGWWLGGCCGKLPMPGAMQCQDVPHPLQHIRFGAQILSAPFVRLRDGPGCQTEVDAVQRGARCLGQLGEEQLCVWGVGVTGETIWSHPANLGGVAASGCQQRVNCCVPGKAPLPVPASLRFHSCA